MIVGERSVLGHGRLVSDWRPWCEERQDGRRQRMRDSTGHGLRARPEPSRTATRGVKIGACNPNPNQVGEFVDGIILILSYLDGGDMGSWSSLRRRALVDP